MPNLNDPKRQFLANLLHQPANCAGRNFQPQNLFGRDLGSLKRRFPQRLID